MNKKNGFTLVEVLSIIAILGVIVILVVPQIGGSINSKKQKELEKIISIIENAAKAYHSFNEDAFKISVNTLVSEKYLTNDLKNPVTGEKLDGCVRIIKDGEGILNYLYASCDNIQVSLTVELNGGDRKQEFQSTYADMTTITLIEPTKENNAFSHWEVVKGNSILDGNKLTIGTTETIIYAIWKNYPVLTVDLNGGDTTQNLNGPYKSGTTIDLLPPTREGYIFKEWEVTSGNGIVSGNTFTMGSSDTTIKAKWTRSLIYSYTCANSSSGTAPYGFTYTGNCEVIDDGNDNWRVKFLTNGTFTPSINTLIDVFLVGGGGGGAAYWDGPAKAGGGGGGYTKTQKQVMMDIAEYVISIGAGGFAGTTDTGGSKSGGDGGTSSAFNISVNGGKTGGGGGYCVGYMKGGNGGSGGGSGEPDPTSKGNCHGKTGSGGIDGANGNGSSPGTGQGTTTREFGETGGTLYSSGGNSPSSKNGGNNTGNGGGGCGGSCTAGKGGSGIVVIRNAR